jgi:hypothetical protein
VTRDHWLVLVGIAVALLVIWLLLFYAVARGRSKGKKLQLEEAYRRFASSGALPDRNRKVRLELLVLAVLVILNIVWLGVLLSRTPDERALTSTSAPSATPGGLPSSTVPSAAADPTNGSELEDKAIQVEDVAASAKPFQTVRITGKYQGGGNTFLRVQRWEGGRWLDFPLPTKTDQSGRFTAHIELGQPGRYQLRMRDPDSGVTSETFILVINA